MEWTPTAGFLAIFGELRRAIEVIGADDRIDMFVSAAVVTAEFAHE